MSVPLPSLLAFDTSTERLAVAARGPRGTCAFNGPGGPLASQQLLPRIHAALAEVGVVLADLAAIAFGQGPGAFTGLRTSCAVAQGLGLGLARPLLPIDSLLVVAEDAFAEPDGVVARGRYAVAADARMDEIYGAVYAFDGEWRTRHAPALYTVAAWNALLEEEGPALRGAAGSALPAFGARLHHLPGAMHRPDETDRAAALLRLATSAHAAGRAIAAEAALPVYLRDKVALTTAERAAARAAVAPTPGPAA